VSPHLRRVIILRLTIAGLTVTLPAARARRRLRAARCACRRRRHHLRGPGRPVDGEPLQRREMQELRGIERVWKLTAPAERSRTW
jgi:hypothetical protein